MHSCLNRAADVGLHRIPNHHHLLRLTQRQFGQLAPGAVEHVAVGFAEVIGGTSSARLQKCGGGSGAWTGLVGGHGAPIVGVGREQRLVSKPNMLFSRSAVYTYSSRIMPQLQPGLAISGGAPPSTCTVCR